MSKFYLKIHHSSGFIQHSTAKVMQGQVIGAALMMPGTGYEPRTTQVTAYTLVIQLRIVHKRLKYLTHLGSVVAFCMVVSVQFIKCT